MLVYVEARSETRGRGQSVECLLHIIYFKTTNKSLRQGEANARVRQGRKIEPILKWKSVAIERTDLTQFQDWGIESRETRETTGKQQYLAARLSKK